MNTINEKIAELETQLAALKAEVNKPSEEWPNYGDVYYLVGQIENFIWSNNEADRDWKKRGLIFRTREEAERFDKRRILIASIREFAGHYKPVWDGETRNHTITYLHNEKLWVVNGWSNNDHLPICGYFKDKETAQACIEKFKDELHILREV